MPHLSFAILIGIVPILLWGSYFYIKNPRRQSGREVAKIFFLGMLSILPVIVFDRWVLDTLMDAIQTEWPFLSSIFVSAVLELLLLILFIILFIVVFSIFHALTLRLIYQLNWRDNFRVIYGRLYSLAPIMLFFGSFLLVEGIFNLTYRDSFILSLAGSTIVFAVSEEYFKYLINPFLVYKKINSVGNAMINALYIGLAFAFVENILFFYVHWNSADFVTIFSYRSLFTTLLHVGTSGLLGYFYGISLFGQSMLANYEIENASYHIPFWMKRFIRKDTIFKSMSVTQGFFLAALIHALFNLLIYLNQLVFSAVLVVMLATVITILIQSKNTQIQYGLIGSKAMPEADFEQLRLKISVLQHTRDIQRANLMSS